MIELSPSSLPPKRNGLFDCSLQWGMEGWSGKCSLYTWGGFYHLLLPLFPFLELPYGKHALTFVMSKVLCYLICKIRNEIQANQFHYLFKIQFEIDKRRGLTL